MTMESTMYCTQEYCGEACIVQQMKKKLRKIFILDLIE